jgi:hypothetical protein
MASKLKPLEMLVDIAAYEAFAAAVQFVTPVPPVGAVTVEMDIHIDKPIGSTIAKKIRPTTIPNATPVT